MPGLGCLEFFIVLIIVMLLFRTGLMTKVSRGLGSAVRSFRQGLNGEDEK